MRFAPLRAALLALVLAAPALPAEARNTTTRIHQPGGHPVPCGRVQREAEPRREPGEPLVAEPLVRIVELRRLVSGELEEARSLQPEASYRELIAATLDYRRWFEMVVLTRWGDEAPRRLGPNHRFSEGEKKLVTYLPFLAAVAVSYDALAESAPRAPRFVLLDDAMAKVSEDNHADLLGLLVDLDLDFIATSERLWGAHATVPELAITEVIRDAELGVILLDHFHWDGATLTGGAGR